MMEILLLTARGERLTLPPFLSWELRRTGSVPCDSFEGVCPWDGGLDGALSQASRLLAEENGRRCFTGVVDECRLTWDGKGGRLSLSARGMAALLLDNESPAMDYQVATLTDILRDHVAPCGVETGKVDKLPAVSGFSVASGTSRWRVVERFARCCGGVEPTFDVEGRLRLTARPEGATWQMGPRTGVEAVEWRDKRYGVVSEVLVQDRRTQTSRHLRNESYTAQGLKRSQVLLLSGKNSLRSLTDAGQYLLDRSAGERLRLELTLTGHAPCQPGDRVELTLERPALSGRYRVLETCASLSSGGLTTLLTLGEDR